MITVPCDSPFLPTDLVQRLAEALAEQRTRKWQWPGPAVSATRCFACAAPVFSPISTAFLDAGGRKVDTWHAALDVCDVAFDDHVGGFLNVNTVEQLHALER